MKRLFSLVLVFALMGCASIKNEYVGIEGKTNVKQISEESVLELFESGTGVLLFSFPESEWCQDIMPIINEIALSSEVEVSYFNVRDIRQSNTEEYQSMYLEIVEYLKTTEFDELLYSEIFVPTLIKIENGEIVDFHLGTTTNHVETSTGLPELNSAQEQELNSIINRILS